MYHLNKVWELNQRKQELSLGRAVAFLVNSVISFFLDEKGRSKFKGVQANDIFPDKEEKPSEQNKGMTLREFIVVHKERDRMERIKRVEAKIRDIEARKKAVESG